METNKTQQESTMKAEPQNEHDWLKKLVGEWTYEIEIEMESGTSEKWHQLSAVYLLVGSLLYLVGTVGVTIAFNVPLNDALAIAKPEEAESANLWSSYLSNWTFWNHIRTVSALAATASFAIALC
jgi:Domain of unknown function (DUF1772)/Protein of unknown function (DUF1579)